MRTSRSGETTAPDRRSALASGILTGLSSLVLSASGAVAAAILAQKFGRDAGTDGLLAAYGVYVTLVLAAQALRLTAVPELTRTEGAVAGSYAAAILVVGLPSTIVVWLFAEPFAELLTGKLPQEAADLAASALPWLVAAAFVQVLAALAAATLAARNRFGAAALGFSAGGVAGLVVFVVLADEHGLVALAWGLAANAAISLGVPLAALGGTIGRLRFEGVVRRLVLLAEAAAVPLALQVLYLIALRGASGIGVGAVTSLSYAYFFAAVLVAATATSLSIISTAELTRRGVEAEAAVEHVVHGSWLCLPPIAAAAGVFALVGDRIAEAVLGDAFSGDVGEELARLVVVLAPWTIAAVGFSLAFPLLYVLERSRVLVPVALTALVLDVVLSLALRELWGLEGLALALGLTTLAVLGALLLALSRRALLAAVASLVRVAVSVGGLAVLSFGAFALVTSDALAAVGGLALYVALLALVRPRGPTRGVGLHARAALALPAEAQAGATARELDRAQPEARREHALPRRGDDARARREVREAHVAAAFPVERRRRVGDLAHHGSPEARGRVDLPRRVRAECVDDRANGRHVRVVEQHSSADLHARRDVPPVERRVGEAVRAVDEHEVERALLEPRQDLVREADPERDARRVDPAGGRLRAEPLLLVRCGRDRLVVRTRRGEDERRGARTPSRASPSRA